MKVPSKASGAGEHLEASSLIINLPVHLLPNNLNGRPSTQNYIRLITMLPCDMGVI